MGSPRRGTHIRPGTVKNPPSVKQMNVRPIFDSRPHRNRGQAGIPVELKLWPDRLLIAVLVQNGMPQWAAEQIRHHPPARFNAAAFYADVLDAAEGDTEAKQRVDYCRWAWQDMRRQELISDTPNRTVGLFEK